MAFRRHPVRVLVPATSANLGPAFDCAGLALGIEDELVAMVSDDEGVLIEVAGAGAADVPRDESHLVVRAMATAFRAMGQSPAGLVLRCRNDIPHGRGLGSSAAAIIGGMVLARALVEGGPDRFPDAELLQWATTMESHPDNISAALHGGLTLAWLADDGRAECIRLQPHPAIAPIVAIPAQSVSTSHARTALPAKVPFPDAAFNLARASLLVHAMTSEPALLLEATADRLHQQARREMYPSSLALVEALRAESIAAMISGAGPSVIVLGTATDLEHVRARAGSAWLVRRCRVCDTGAREVPVEGA
ncbi:MAG: homoserine kinase [Actinomycetales bacterium]|nr:homoserine kinase [Actinomycetales bacterium]